MAFSIKFEQADTGYETLMQMDRDSRDTKAQVKPGHTFSFHIYTENGQPGIKSNMSTNVQSFTDT